MGKEKMKGLPEHGEEYMEDEEKQLDLELDDQEEEQEEKKKAPSTEDLLQQLADLKAEVRGLRAPAAPAQKVPEPTVEEEIDWEKELFTDPNAAVKKLRATIEKEISGKLRGEYQSSRNQESFWDGFYAKNKDLDREQDDELVKSVLQKNLPDLANLPVSEASAKLADLTRERILRYSGGKKAEGKKAVAEGAAPVTPAKEKKEETKIVTLSDLIRQRKMKRAGKGTAA